MFDHLTDLSFQRTRKQAVGFYLAALLGLAVSTALIVIIYLLVTGAEPLPKGWDVAGSLRVVQGLGVGVVPLIVFFLSTALAGLIMRAKKIYSGVALVCVLLAAVLSALGALLSLIPVAYLTTLPKSASSQGT